MDDHLWIMIIAIVILVLLSGFFSATETAFTSLNRIKIKNRANDGDRKAQKILELTDDYDRLLTTILIGNNIVNIGMTAIATVLFIALLGSEGPTVATIVMTLVVLIFGEITPKSLAKEAPEAFARFAGPVIRFLNIILTPFNVIFRSWKRLVSRMVRVDESQNLSEEELITWVEEAETEGALEQEQSELIQNAIEFNDVDADEVMTPRVDIVAMPLETTEEEAADLFRTTGFSRIPVYEDDMDSVLGILNQKDFYNNVFGQGRSIEEYIKPVIFVAGSMKIDDLLRKLQANKTHMAVIVDEYGGTEGLVTMEDIIEELVGEIYDEHDAIVSQEVTPLQNGSYRVLCSASIKNVLDYFDVEEDMDVNTVNGWVVLCLDKLPAKGDRFETKVGGKIFKGRVTKATNKKALEINLEVEDAPEDEEE